MELADTVMRKFGHYSYGVLEAMVQFHPKKVDARTLAYRAEDFGQLDLSPDLSNLCT
jgi:hypothetical protein